MIRRDEGKNGTVIVPIFHWFLCFFCLFVGVLLWFLILQPIPWEELGLPAPLAFVLAAVWATLAFGVALWQIVCSPRKITVTNEGISAHFFFFTRRLLWHEVQDWGLSYSGTTDWFCDMGVLYFSQTPLLQKNAREKKLFRCKFKAHLFGADYTRAKTEVLAVFRDATGASPFIGEE